jgi:hypothetical protein
LISIKFLTVVVGYKDMPVDGGRYEASTEVNFKSHLSINQGSLWGRIYRYITFYRSSAKGYTDREGLPYKIRKS